MSRDGGIALHRPPQQFVGGGDVAINAIAWAHNQVVVGILEFILGEQCYFFGAQGDTVDAHIIKHAEHARVTSRSKVNIRTTNIQIIVARAFIKECAAGEKTTTFVAVNIDYHGVVGVGHHQISPGVYGEDCVGGLLVRPVRTTCWPIRCICG